MFKRGDIANNLFLICFTHMECILCGWGRIGYSDVSIHAPTRGATRKTAAGPGPGDCFNPRTHTGCDPDAEYTPSPGLVSIHAPTRGATSLPYMMYAPRLRFNPRTHTGCDQTGTDSSHSHLCFNPRTHTGCDIDSIPIG